MAKKISQLTQATEVKSDDVTVIVQDGETKKLPLNMMVTKQDIENKKIAGLTKLDEIEATYENDTYTPTITVKNKSSVKTGEGDEVDYSANVMDGHAKSAILKGNTLVNLSRYKNLECVQNKQFSLTKPNLIRGNKTYILIFTHTGADGDRFVFQEYEGETGWIINHTVTLASNTPKQYYIFTTKENTGLMRVQSTTENNYTLNNLMVLEYQNGMENWDIPYFEGMQSVKMPVLTTTGNNLLDPNYLKEQCLKVTSYATYTDGNIIFYSGAFHEKRLIALDFEPNTQYAFNFKMSGKSNSQLHIIVYYTDSSKSFYIPYISDKTDTISGVTKANATVDYITISFGNGAADCVLYVDECSLFKSNTVMPHEPYKSNILHTPEEVVLRSLPNGVKDTLNLNTGEYTQRIGEITFNGSEEWSESASVSQNHYCAYTSVEGSKNELSYNIVCNSLPVRNILSATIDYEGCMLNKWNSGDMANVIVKIANSKLSSTSVKGIKAYLQSNPLTVQYELATPIVKSVDLIPSGTHPSTTPYCWKDGHIQLSSSGLLPSLEYSVVTSRAGQISQNVAMIVKNDKRIFDLEILLAGGLVNTTYQALTLQNQVETGLSKVSLSSEKEPDYLLYHMIMKLIEEKAYKLDDLAEKVSVFYLYEKLSDEQFETIYSKLYPFVEDEYIELPEDGEIIEEPIVDEVLEEVENEVVM